MIDPTPDEIERARKTIEAANVPHMLGAFDAAVRMRMWDAANILACGAHFVCEVGRGQSDD